MLSLQERQIKDDSNYFNAMVHLNKGQYLQALELFKRFLGTDPKNASLNYKIALCFENLHQEQSAILFYKRALSLGLGGTDEPEAYLGLGSCYRATGNYNDAVEAYAKGLKKNPNHSALLIFLAISYFDVKRSDEAVRILLKVILQVAQDPHIEKSKKLIEYYSKNLLKVW